jgi:phosphoserine phosphatase
MQQVLTLVAGDGRAGLDNSMLAHIEASLAANGARVDTASWLALDVAADLAFEGIGDDAAERAARAVIGAAAVDVLAQPSEGRRKRLLVADMDSTIVTSETLDELASFAGVKDKVAVITARSMRGEIDFVAALVERVAMLKDLSTAALEQTWARVSLVPGAVTLVRTMRQSGAYTALVSGGFRFFTSRVRELAGFDYDEANELEVADGKLTGRVVPPIVNRDGKLLALRRLSEARGLPLAAALAVGDGANDRDMVRAAGLGVAYRGQATLKAAARALVDHGDLTTILYFQGYRRDEFAADEAR